MAAAYASLVSLMHLTDQILLHPYCGEKFHWEQVEHIKSLHEAVSVLKTFLESDVYRCGNDRDGLESRIANAAYALEDILSSYVVDDVLGQSPQEQVKEENDGKRAHFGDDFEKAMSDIKKALIAMEKINFHERFQKSVGDVYSIDERAPTVSHHVMEFDDKLILNLMEEITSRRASRQIISINGMGGIGKTTLAKIIYAKRVVRECFDVSAFLRVSPGYDRRALLVSFLDVVGIRFDDVLATPDDQLGLMIYQYLTSRRYFIILDDMWSTKVWEELMRFLPENHNRSRVVITTRNSDVAKISGTSHEMNLLDETNSWKLLQNRVFDTNCCPPELEKIGKNIARDCRGLPLSIVFIGRELENTAMTPNEWKDCAKNLNKIIDARCLETLSLSYKHLPIHLKPCFLYMGVYPENCEVYVPELIRRWIAEGFLKPVKTKSIEEVAEEYLKELVDRHLISFVKRGRLGEMEVVGMHALTRRLCLRKAHEERFLYITNVDNPVFSMNVKQRIAMQLVTSFSSREYATLHSTESSFSSSLKLMRVFNLKRLDIDTANAFLKLVNSGYLKFIHEAAATLEIWKMPELIHLTVDQIFIPDPQCSKGDEPVLENLKTLSCVHNFKCLEVVTKRMPHIKKLGIVYSEGGWEIDQGLAHYDLQNLSYLYELQSLTCTCLRNEGFLAYAVLPRSLKNLTLECNIHWDDVSTKVGSLPNLEKLKLETYNSGESWILSDVEFSSLKFLRIKCSHGLVHWEAEDSNFPVLERLILISMDELQEIPSDMGYMSTLKSIELVNCGDSVVASANEILEIQHDFGNDTFQLMVTTGGV